MTETRPYSDRMHGFGPAFSRWPICKVTVAAWLVLGAVACALHAFPQHSVQLAWAGCSEGERRDVSRAFGRAANLSAAVVAAVDAPENRERLSSNDLVIARNTDDLAYRERDALELARERPDGAIRNAPSYAGFAASVVFRRAPRRHFEPERDDD